MTQYHEIKDFVDATKPQLPENMVLMARGTITQHDAGNKLVNVVLGGGTVELNSLRYFAHYIPAINDDVHCLIVGPDVMVLGKIAR